MTFTSKVVQLVLLEARLEWKNKQSITALLIYSFASIFVTYLAFQQTIDLTTWNSLFWLIMLFASTNAIAKSFLQDSKGLQLYYYSMLSPKHIIIAKIIYNLMMWSIRASQRIAQKCIRTYCRLRKSKGLNDQSN
jgi:heme exporter protein B